MHAREIRGLFNQARRIAAWFAEKCDFVATDEIEKAGASFSEDTAYVGALYKDPVERVQIITSYTYASGLLGLNFFTSSDEDGPAEHGKRYMVITLSLKPSTAKKSKEAK